MSPPSMVVDEVVVSVEAPKERADGCCNCLFLCLLLFFFGGGLGGGVAAKRNINNQKGGGPGVSLRALLDWSLERNQKDNHFMDSLF